VPRESIVYHAFVRRIVRNGFRKMNEAHDAAHIVAQFDDDATFTFLGDHALGCERRGRAAIAAWFVHLFETFPNLAFEPLAVVVAGPPWATMVATRFRVVSTLPDGSAYANEGMQFMRIRFGKVQEDRIYEDTAKLMAALTTIAQFGAKNVRATNVYD